MKLTVLGNNGPYPCPNGACSGYLIESKEAKILIDCGNGVFANLQKVCDYKELDAVILSHLHSDHISDVFVMKYALGIVKSENYSSIPLFTTMDDSCMVDNLNYNDAFDLRKITNDQVEIKDLKISFNKTIHPIECYGIKIEDEESTFVYSADTAYDEKLVQFAKNADLFLCESGVLEKDRHEETPHLSVKQACQLANESSVKKLVLTHFWPEYKLEDIRKEATEEVKVELILSEIMKSYNI